MSGDADVKATLEAVLKWVEALRLEINSKLSELGSRLDAKGLGDQGERADRIESVVAATRSEMLALRADFREFKQKVEEVLKGVA